jgi:cell wall-associated NlpC family hydrolase
VRNLGQVIYNPKDLKKGDIVAMGRPGDTWHVGVYFGNQKVLHQSAMRGYTVGVFGDLNAFINYHRGFYIVRPYINILEEQLFVSPEIS